MIQLSASLHEMFSNFSQDALDNGPLSDRDRSIATLTAAVALDDQDTVRKAIVAAKQAGVSNEEIGQICSIVVALHGLRVNNLGQMSASSEQQSQSTCCR